MNLITLLMSLSLTVHIVHNGQKEACSAVYISPTEALTAAHCVESPKDKIWIKDDEDKSYSASLIKRNTKLDLCLIKVTSPKHPYAKLGAYVNRGDRIFTINSGNDIPHTYNEGIIENIIEDPENGTLSLLHSAFITGGASGSGLFNSKGELVGINTASYKSAASAVDVTAIYTFLTGRLR